MKTHYSKIVLLSICTIISVLGVVFLYNLWIEKNKKLESLKSNPKFKTAIITEVRRQYVSKASYHRFNYDIIDPMTHQRKEGYKRIRKNKLLLDKSNYSDFVGKKFPVIYSEEYSDKPVILIIESDFEKYNLAFPDSLKWILKYQK